MATIFHLAGRNIKVFLRDRTSVFFSLLSVFIIIGLYAVFLGDTTVRSLEGAIGKDVAGVRWLVDSWIMSGILVVNSITVTLGVNGLIIDDISRKRMHGFLVAPINRGSLVAAYLVAANAVGFLISVVALALAELYIMSSGGSLLGLAALLKVLGLLAYNIVCSSTLIFFCVSFIKTSSGFSTLSIILGTTIGFITGIYVPVGVLPEALQTVIKFIPASHAVVLMRQIIMEAPLDKVFAQAPPGLYDEFTQVYGIRMFFGSREVTAPVMLLVIGAAGLLFLILSIFRMSRHKLG